MHISPSRVPIWQKKILGNCNNADPQVARPSGMPEQNSKDKQDVAAARRHWINYLERNQSIIVQVVLTSDWLILSCPVCPVPGFKYLNASNPGSSVLDLYI